MSTWALQRIEELKAENARLREALGGVINSTDVFYGARSAWEKAKKALEEKC